jgi:rsbT co-antagonist protein RsbR
MLPSSARLSFQHRLILAFGGLSLLVAAMAAVALWGLGSLRSSASQAASDSQTSRLASEVALRALLCRRYEKDFFLNSGAVDAQDAPLQLWHQASFDLRGAIKAFEDAATTDADREQAAAWRDAWRNYVRDFGSIEIAINGGVIKTPQDALKAFEPFQPNIQTLTDQAVQLAQQKSVSAQQASSGVDAVGASITWLVMVIAILVFGASIISSLLFPTWLVRPIKTLREAATRLANGDLAARVALRRRDELGMLAQSFDRMAERIQHNTAELASQYDQANTARAAAEAAHHKIAEQLATIEEQRAVISEMSVPILPLNDSTLVLPLVGALDSDRMRQAQERVLQAIEDTSAHYLLLDITGVPVVDTLVAQGLLRIIQAANLLGCTIVLVGIRPEVAQAIVGLGLDLRRVPTQSTLQSGIAYTLRQPSHGLHGGTPAGLPR